MITLVSVDRIDAVWPMVSEGLERASRRTGGDVLIADLWRGCRLGEMQMLIAHDGERIQGVSVWRAEKWLSGGKLRLLDQTMLPETLVYIETDDIDGMLLKINGGGGTTETPKTLISENAGYFALFKDPDNNLLGLWSKK